MLNRNFISPDNMCAINTAGECFTIGDTVLHSGAPGESAVIQSFEIDSMYNEVTAKTSRGSCHVDFIHKKVVQQ